MNENHSNAFAYINTDEFTRISSSGGAFLGIVNAFFKLHINEKCSVYGSKLNADLSVSHDRAVTLDEAKKFCGSKYVRSKYTDVLGDIQKDLLDGFNVLFSGTPCQISGLHKFLDSKCVDKQKLLTVDIVCHGTPKEEFWQDYKRYLEKKENSRLVNYSFRYKPCGWKGYPVYAEFDNGRVCINTFEISRYISLFRKDLLMNQGCFKCPFPGKFESNITIADFWGIELYMPEVDTKHGVSLMIFHDEAHELLKKELKNSAKLMKETEDDSYIHMNHNLTQKTRMPDKYDAFWKDYKEKGMEYILKHYGDNNIKGRVKFTLKYLARKTGVLYLIKIILHKA